MSDRPGGSAPNTPWHLWLVGILAIVWNAMGAFDYLMTQMRNASYMSHFTPEQLEYFNSFPAWATAFWAIAVWSGVLGAVLLVLKRRQAAAVFLVSLAAMTVTAVYNFGLSSGVQIMGAEAVAFSGVIFVAGAGLLMYARAMVKRGVLV